jgi:hypothetical protein
MQQDAEIQHYELYFAESKPPVCREYEACHYRFMPACKVYQVSRSYFQILCSPKVTNFECLFPNTGLSKHYANKLIVFRRLLSSLTRNIYSMLFIVFGTYCLLISLMDGVLSYEFSFIVIVKYFNI